MEVRQGWSGEFSPNRWGKLDVILDEGDLRRVLIAAGLGDIDPTAVPTTLAFQILDAESERLLLAKLISHFNYTGDEHRERLGALSAARTAALDRLKRHLGHTGSPDAG